MGIDRDLVEVAILQISGVSVALAGAFLLPLAGIRLTPEALAGLGVTGYLIVMALRARRSEAKSPSAMKRPDRRQ